MNGTSNSNIIWRIRISAAGNYEILVDQEFKDSGEFKDGDTIEYNLDSLTEGTYIVSLTAFIGVINEISEVQVVVSKNSFSDGISTPQLNFQFNSAYLLIIILIFRKRFIKNLSSRST